MASSADSPPAVRIATLNTWGMRGNWPGRRRVLSDGLLALDADLLTLQETIVDDGYDQAADVLGSRYEIIHHQHRETDGQGISTASRWPVGEVIELDINVTSRTGDLLARKPGHVIVAGDFDADPAAASIRFWTGRQSLNGHSVCYRDAWESARPGEPGHTFVPGNPNSADCECPTARSTTSFASGRPRYAGS